MNARFFLMLALTLAGLALGTAGIVVHHQRALARARVGARAIEQNDLEDLVRLMGGSAREERRR